MPPIEIVITGLDPVVHLLRGNLLRRMMDARIKSGHDERFSRRQLSLIPIQFSNSQMVLHTHSRSRGARRPRLGSNFAPPKKRGRREDRVRAAPAVSCAGLCKRDAHEHTGSAETLRPSPRNGFTAYFALSPAIRICLSPSPRGLRQSLTPGWAGFASAGLDANPEAVRTTRLHRTKQRRRQRAVRPLTEFNPPCDPRFAPDAAASTASHAQRS
jgi:hypothetical protein